MIVIRLSVLPFVKAPVPSNDDEFSYLLAGDTFAHGRLANPPHPMWVFFETLHVNQFPTYGSKYFPGQGAVLALGEVLGHPWIGVLVSMGCFCGVLTWALQGWVPSRWALLGGILAAIEFGPPRNYWINSYWGGAVAAFGGALVLGAYSRILRHQRVRDSLLFAAGIGILANSRPYEGAIFSLIFLAALAWGLLRKPATERGEVVARVVVPMAGVLILFGAFIGFYNWRVTGDPFLLPYTVNDRTYLTVPKFQWQKMGPPLQYRNHGAPLALC
ncbi:MAG TPA: hypothetical protein VI488_15190 [Candidatus Angelobacter sp.]